MKSLVLADLIFLFSLLAHIGLPKLENGYDLKNNEDSLNFPFIKFENIDYIAIGSFLSPFIWIFGINKDKEPCQTLKMPDNIQISLLEENNLSKDESINRINTITKFRKKHRTFF